MGLLRAQKWHRLLIISLLTLGAGVAQAEVPACVKLLQNIGMERVVYRLPKFEVAKMAVHGREFTYQFTNGLWATGHQDDDDHEYHHSASVKKYGTTFNYKYMVRFTDSPMSAFELYLKHQQDSLVSRHDQTSYYEDSRITFSYLPETPSHGAIVMSFSLRVEEANKEVVSSSVVLYFDRARYLRRVVVRGSKDPRVLAHYNLVNSRLFNSKITFDLKEDHPHIREVLKAITKQDLKQYRLRADVFDQVARRYATGEPVEFSSLFETEQ